MESGVVVDVQAKKRFVSWEQRFDVLMALAKRVDEYPGSFGVALVSSNEPGTMRSELREGIRAVGIDAPNAADLNDKVRLFVDKLVRAGLNPMTVCQRLSVQVHDFGAGTAGEESTLETLRHVLIDQNQAGAALAALVDDGLNMIELRGKRNAVALKSRIFQEGIRIVTSANPVLDIIARFEAVTSQRATERRIFGIQSPLVRSEVTYIEEAARAGRNVLVTGDAGVGKSGVAIALYKSYADQGLPVLYLDAREYGDIVRPDDLSGLSGLPDNLLDSIHRVAQVVACRILVDQIDSAATDQAGKAFLRLAGDLSRVSQLQVVVFSRTLEGYERELVLPLLDAGFEEIPCQVITESAAMQTLSELGINEPSEQLTTVCRNLLNMDIIARIRSEVPEYNLSSLVDEWLLWEALVKVIARDEGRSWQGVRFGGRVIEEAIKLARTALASEETMFVLGLDKTEERRRLESWGVIEHAGGYFYKFRHEKFRDFLYAYDAVNSGALVPEVMSDVGTHRVTAILALMDTLYPRLLPGKHEQFVRSLLDG